MIFLYRLKLHVDIIITGFCSKIIFYFKKNPARIALTDFISGYRPRCKAYYEVKTFIDQNIKINNFGDRGGIVED